MASEARRLEVVENVFGIEAAGRLLAEALAPWVQELGNRSNPGGLRARRPTGSPVRCCGCHFRKGCAAKAAWSVRRR